MVLCFCIAIRSLFITCSIKKEYAHCILLNVTRYQRESYLLTKIYGKKFVCTTNKSTDVTHEVVTHLMKAYKGSGGTAPLILNLSTRWRGVVSLIPRSLYCQVNSAYMTTVFCKNPKFSLFHWTSCSSKISWHFFKSNSYVALGEADIVLRCGRYISYGGLLVSPYEVCSYVVTGAYIICHIPGCNHSLVMNITIKSEKDKYIFQLQSYLKNFLNP